MPIQIPAVRLRPYRDKDGRIRPRIEYYWKTVDYVSFYSTCPLKNGIRTYWGQDSTGLVHVVSSFRFNPWGQLIGYSFYGGNGQQATESLRIELVHDDHNATFLFSDASIELEFYAELFRACARLNGKRHGLSIFQNGRHRDPRRLWIRGERHGSWHITLLTSQISFLWKGEEVGEPEYRSRLPMEQQLTHVVSHGVAKRIVKFVA